MGEVNTLFQKDCECRYIPGMEAVLNYDNKIRDMMTPSFMDRIMVTGEIYMTDYFYLRAIAFLRIANAEMVAEYLRYFRNFYGKAECANLLQPKGSAHGADVFASEENWKNDVAECRRKLLRLAKRYLIFSENITRESEDHEYIDTVFCANATTFSLVRTIFGETPCFGYANLSYERYYSMTPIQKIMENMHACRVGILAFSGHKDRATLIREQEIIFGSKKEKYTPTMIADVSCGEYVYKVIIEPVHFTPDERLITKSEHQKNVEALLIAMGKLIGHYNYIENMFQEKPVKERVRFLLAVENVNAMREIVKFMEPYKEKYSGKIFFTTDTFLKGTNCLQDAIFMAKEMPEEGRLGLIRPTDSTIKVTQNEWIYEDMSDL